MAARAVPTPISPPVTAIVTAFLAVQPAPLTRSEAMIDPAPDRFSVAQTTWLHGDTSVLRLLTVQGGGHVWPGGPRARRQADATDDISATTEILRFFDQMP